MTSVWCDRPAAEQLVGVARLGAGSAVFLTQAASSCRLAGCGARGRARL